jgi:hypothetical protein
MAPYFAAVLFTIVMSTVLRTGASSGDQKSLALAQEALNEILTRAAPIAGECHTPIHESSIQNYHNTGIDEGCSKYQKTCDWMAKIPDRTKLVQMNLPGTHDTATCKL